jgi:RNA polymerase sigma-70 factor (ECF subfamily)
MTATTWTIEHERALVTAAQQGGQTAFGQLYDHYLPRVYRRVCSLVPESDVEDVTQEIWISVARSIGNFRGGSSFSTWLYRIVKRRIADYYRKDARQAAQVPLEDVDHKMSANPLSGMGDALLMRQALRAIPESHREIILLRLADGLPFDEVAQRLDLSLGAAKMRFYRAVESCQEKVKELESDVTFH